MLRKFEDSNGCTSAFLQVFLPAAVAGNSLAVAAASAFHVAMRFATSFGSLGKTHIECLGKVEDLYGELAIYADINIEHVDIVEGF